MPPYPLLILAGGRATRLGKLSASTPKFLMPVDAHRVFADLQLEWARHQGFEDIILSVGYLGNQIEKYCGDGSKYGLRIRYSFDGDQLLGTGGAVKKALKDEKSFVALTYGDTLLALEAKAILQKAAKESMHAVMTVFKNTVPGHVCNANFDGNLVFYSKSHPKPEFQFIDYGFLVLSPEFVQTIPNEVPLDLALPLEQASQKNLLKGVEIKERFWEMGTPESLEEFKKRFKSFGS